MEVGGRRAETRSRKSEVRGQEKAEISGRRTEVGGRIFDRKNGVSGQTLNRYQECMKA